MFKLTEIDLGTVQSGKELIVEFPYDNIRLITKTIASCDCAIPSDFNKKKKIVVKFTPKAVPQHLINDGRSSYKTEKNIEVHYMTQGDDREKVTTLKIIANVH